mmetsp:Transcript_10513/g.14843  ORF Transcript_10513/g.14843 Transcript_10513/m.14843 type:complete len:322 (+) Transcript_10513:34-999(+)
MCCPTHSVVPVSRKDGVSSSRSRRRERRKALNQNVKEIPAEGDSVQNRQMADNKKRNRVRTRSESCNISTSSSSTCKPSDRKKYNNAKYSSKQKGNNSPKSKRRNAKIDKTQTKPIIVAVHDLTDEEKERYVAIDCEMVGVGPYASRSALARVSIVNWYGDVVFDTFVKVEEKVTDYRTFVSGVRPSDLISEHALPYEECREKVENFLDNKIIVGHALKNDFYVLNICHPWFMIRDTAKYEPFMKPDTIDDSKLIPKKLKTLAHDKLGMIIQREGEEHDSIEDATAAMELYKKARLKWEKAVEWKMKKTDEIISMRENAEQ